MRQHSSERHQYKELKTEFRDDGSVDLQNPHKQVTVLVHTCDPSAWMEDTSRLWGSLVSQPTPNQ